MAENLKYDAGSESWSFYDDPSFVETYGRLYDWETAIEACPDGWRLPDHNELNLLVENMGGNEAAGEALKSENHLSLLLGGFRFPEGSYDAIVDIRVCIGPEQRCLTITTLI